MGSAVGARQTPRGGADQGRRARPRWKSSSPRREDMATPAVEESPASARLKRNTQEMEPSKTSRSGRVDRHHYDDDGRR